MNSKPDKLIPALYGGVIMALISTVPFVNLVNCLCCAGILFGGVMAVYFYKNNFTPDTPPFTSGDCIAVGAIAGVISAFITTILGLIMVALFGDVMQNLVMEFLRNSRFNIPDEAMQQIENALRVRTGMLFIMAEFGQHLIIHTLFGLLGGLIGYSIFKRKQQVMPPPAARPPAVTP